MQSPSSPNTWLTSRRLRAHAAIVALALWAIYLWTIATPGLRDRHGNLKGTDFLHFYTLGSLAIEYRGADLYDLNAQAALVAQRVPQAAGIRYLPLYPPQVSMLFAPLAYFSYKRALILWWAFSAAVYGICVHRLWHACPNLWPEGMTVWIAALGFPAFFHLMAWGQTSALALACFTVIFFLLRERREFLAGLALGCLIFKPQLGVAAAILFVGMRMWKVAAGAVISAIAQSLVGVLYYGVGPLRLWLQELWNVGKLMSLLEPKPYQTHSLRTFWSMLLPWPRLAFVLYLLSAAAVLYWTFVCWKQRNSSLTLRFSALLFATVLVAPHLTVYDLVILAPAFLLLADWVIAQPHTPVTRNLGTTLYFVYMLPLIGPLARWTHLQFSVIAMVVAVCLISRLRQAAGSETQ